MLQQDLTRYRTTNFVVETTQGRWIIPGDCQLLKRLLEIQGIQAEDLYFKSKLQCQIFIKKLFLLALDDEYQNRTPSSLAELGRQLMDTKNAII